MYIDNYGRLVRSDELYHHGILGQKYGVRNGPPYPLGANAHSASEKKAGWKKSLRSSRIRYGAQSTAKDTKNTKPAKKDSNKSPGLKFLLSVGMDVLYMNPVGFAMDTKRLIDYGRSKVKGAFENKRTSKLEVDKKTGFHLKNKDMTPEQDMKHINPGYKNFDTNTKNNCMLCTTAYELRRRGYDVQAGTSTTGFQNKNVLEWFPKGKLESIYASSSTNTRQAAKDSLKVAYGLGGREKYDKLSSSLLKHGDGARGNLMVSWNMQGGGHSVVWENQNGSVIIRDCQSGKVYRSPGQISKLLSKTFSATYVRTDNVDFDEKKLKGLIK